MFHEILESSWSYQEMVQKGIDQGELKASRSFLIRIVEKRFPTLLTLAQQRVVQLNNIALLDALIEKLFSVQTVEQAKQVLTASDTFDSTAS